jgi:hypothetical protein
MNDTEMLATVRESLAGVHLDRPLETILARGRSRRRQRRAAAAGTLVLAASLAAALAGGLGGAASPARPDATPPRLAAAWSVTAAQDGTITVKLRTEAELGDQGELQRALNEAGAPAIVKTGNCDWPRLIDYGDRGLDPLPITPSGQMIIRITPSRLPPGAMVVFVISREPDGGRASSQPGTVVVYTGIMAPRGIITCQP